jgi:hypothetical protein
LALGCACSLDNVLLSCVLGQENAEKMGKGHLER